MYVDPVLTANLYCSGHLDEAFYQVIGPFWRGIRQIEPGAGAYVWTLRAGEGGEHLKIRLHGPESLAKPARALLQHTADAFLARLGAPEEGSLPWRSETGSFGLDGEAGSGHPDRSLVWTAYQRSHVWLGGGPYLDDDGYVSRMTRCLSAACERVLLLEGDPAGKIPLRLRQRALLEGLIAGLAVAVDARPAYLEYHRDRLLRLRARTEAGRLPDLLELFDRRVAAMESAAVALRQSAGSAWVCRANETEPKRSDAAWCGALANLGWYIRPLCDDPDYAIDQAAADPCFVPIFKALHGFANQLGLNLVEEAFAHHFLRTVMGEEEDRDEPVMARVAAEPEWPLT